MPSSRKNLTATAAADAPVWVGLLARLWIRVPEADDGHQRSAPPAAGNLHDAQPRRPNRSVVRIAPKRDRSPERHEGAIAHRRNVAQIGRRVALSYAATIRIDIARASTTYIPPPRSVTNP